MDPKKAKNNKNSKAWMLLKQKFSYNLLFWFYLIWKKNFNANQQFVNTCKSSVISI